MSVRIALAGNPNSGKTSLFNRITGAMQKVGNWGGVTVEIKEGHKIIDGEKVTFVDLPGTYSLSAFSEEEQVARDYLVNEKTDVVINVVDATNLDRHLYLTVQLMELGVKPIIALNMWDETAARGIVIDVKQLQALLGCPVVPTSARTGEGVELLMEQAVSLSRSENGSMPPLKVPIPVELETEVENLASIAGGCGIERCTPWWIALKLFEHDREIERLLCGSRASDDICEIRDRSGAQISATLGYDTETIITESRYGYIAGLSREVVSMTRKNAMDISDTVDSVLTHRFWAYPIFIVFMWLLFQATFKLGEYPMGWIEGGVGWLMGTVQGVLPQSWFRDMLVDGVIAGVGGVIVFLPNILILFLGISVMEDTGYMARAAFIMDRFMHRIGLHGKSFIPMLMGLGCSVPAIMAARTLESRSDRIKTILLTPLVSCSARLPVFVLFAGALFPEHAGNMVFLFQVVFGFTAFIVMALLFKATLFRKSEDIPFVMELPPYRIPTGRSVLIHMWQKAEHYLKKMGGVVLLFSVLLWWASVFPRSPHIEAEYDAKIGAVSHIKQVSEEQRQSRIEALRAQKHAAVMEQTWIGRIGKFLEPAVRPFGTDWRGAVSLVTGFVAKEIVVGSMGVLYAVGNEEDEESEGLRGKVREHFTPLSAFAFMLFVLLYTPCLVALVTVIRELKNWRWSFFSVGYQLAFAWSAATAVYQAGRLFGLK